MFQPLDGPSKQYKLTVTNATVLEVVKPTESALEDRKVVTINPQSGKVKIFFGDGVATPSPATVASDGIILFKNGMDTFEATHQQPLFILADTSDVDVIIVERA